MELDIGDPVPTLAAPAVTHQPEQGFWRGAQAGEEQVDGLTPCRHGCRWP